MKNKLKILSVVLAAVMVVSCLPMFVMADDPVVTKHTVFTGTDFSGLSNDQAALNVTSANYGYKFNDVVNGTEKNAILLNSSVSPYGLLVNDGYWPTGNRVTAFSFDYKNNGWSYVFFAYDKSGKNGLGFLIGNDGYTNGLMIKAYKSESGSVAGAGDNDAKFICDKRYPGPNQVNCHYQEPLHIDGTVEYISDTKAKLTLTITATTADLNGTTLKANGGKTTVTGSFTYNLSTSRYTTFKNFGDAEYGLWFKSGSSSYLADLKVDSYAPKANEFVDGHTVLNKTLAEITPTDEDDVTAALSDYDAITDSTVKTLVAATGTKEFLDAAKAKIDDATTAEQATAYISAYSEAIAKGADAASMTDSKAQAFGKAVDAYNALPENVKSRADISELKGNIDLYNDDVAARLKANGEVTFDSQWVADNYFTVPGGTDTPFTYYNDGYVQHSGSTVIPLAGDATTLKTVEFDYQYTSSTNLASTFYSLYSSDGTETKAMTSNYQDNGWLFKINDVKTILGCKENVSYANEAPYRNAFGKWNISGKDWVKVKIDYDFGTYTTNKQVKVTYTFTYSGQYGLSWTNNTTMTYDENTDTYSTVWHDVYTLTGENAYDYSFAFGNGKYNIKDLKVYTDKRAASAFEQKYEGITSTDKNYTAAKAEYEKLGSAQTYLTADWKSALSDPTSTVFFEDTFDSAEQSAVNWTTGTVTKTRDRTANFDNALMLAGNETATLTEAVWPKGTKPAFASITFAAESTPVIMFGADMSKNDGTLSGIGLWAEGPYSLKTYLCKDGAFGTQGTNDFICGSSMLMTSSGINKKVLQSTNYSSKYYTTIDVAFSYTATQVTLTYTTRIYNTETGSYLVLPSSTRSASISNITDFRPYIMAKHTNASGAVLKITDFKYYTAEKLADKDITKITDLGSNIYLGDEEGNYKSALAFTGTVAINDSILYKSIAMGTEYAANIGTSVTVNSADAVISTDNIPSLVKVNEIGAYVAPYIENVTDITDAKATVSGTAPASGVTSYGVIVNGTQSLLRYSFKLQKFLYEKDCQIRR